VTGGHDGRSAFALCGCCFESREEISGSLFFGGVMVSGKRSPKDPARKIAKLLAAIEKKMDAEIKCTIGDYIRLLQAQQDFDRDTPRDIEVTWVESLKANDAEK
jgi:hypothetical protein